MSETTTATKPELKIVQTLSGLLVLGTDDYQLAAAHIRAELHVDRWGGSFGGQYVRRYRDGKATWTARYSDPRAGIHLPKDAQLGVLFTSPWYVARREPFPGDDGREWLRAHCNRGHHEDQPNTGIGRATLAAWESRHQHTRGNA
ncbi:hypothetical protein [Phycicoccus sp.]|uniref:hypothetical protein n=1 Tax=Phycicoccus sp. TaxID=1902410 RepID=UPI002CC144D2|nr:hypothetical protein [Phycicoccus sp.]HMM95316.1 hypothetical protein [Phycicoccus sp.]